MTTIINSWILKNCIESTYQNNIQFPFDRNRMEFMVKNNFIRENKKIYVWAEKKNQFKTFCWNWFCISEYCERCTSLCLNNVRTEIRENGGLLYYLSLLFIKEKIVIILITYLNDLLDVPGQDWYEVSEHWSAEILKLC